MNKMSQYVFIKEKKPSCHLSKTFVPSLIRPGQKCYCHHPGEGEAEGSTNIVDKKVTNHRSDTVKTPSNTIQVFALNLAKKAHELKVREDDGDFGDRNVVKNTIW